MAIQDLVFLPKLGKTHAFALKEGETLVIECEENLSVEEATILTERLQALGIQWILVGPNFKAVSQTRDSGARP